jgi:fatty-acid desaturase
MFQVLHRSFFNSHSFGSQVMLGIAQLAAHLSLFYVIFNFSWSAFLISLFIYFLMTSVGVSITAHRYLTHHSFSMPRWFEVFGSLCFSLSLQGSTIAWVAMHREHHRFSDTERDPHCPQHGLLKTHFLSMFYTPKIKFAVKLVRDEFHSSIHRFYWPINFTYSLMLFLIFGLKGVFFFHLFPAFLCWQAIGIAKTFSHLFGYRNFATEDHSYNIPILGYLTFGEAWHNNHHARPAYFSFSVLMHEVDISAVIIIFGSRFLGFSLKGKARDKEKLVLVHE